jgi:hypothetical protein
MKLCSLAKKQGLVKLHLVSLAGMSELSHQVHTQQPSELLLQLCFC